MRTILLTLLIYALSTTVLAEPRTMKKTVMCNSTSAVFEQLTKDFEETAQWTGVSPAQSTQLVLTVNLKTGAWTLVEYTSDWACILAAGERSSSRWGTPV